VHTYKCIHFVDYTNRVSSAFALPIVHTAFIRAHLQAHSRHRSDITHLFVHTYKRIHDIDQISHIY